jgi:hypothetical protein
VISLRKEVSQVLGQEVTQDDCQPDGHSYFINVLERVREILRPSTEKVEFRDEKRLETLDQKLGNIFEALDLEEQLDATDSSSVPQSAQSDRKSLPKQTYDIERMHDEILMSSLFFFHDLSQIRELVRVVWMDYSQGRADLSTASLVTNTAIEIMQRNLEDHLAIMAGQHEAPEEDDWIFWVYAHICHGMDLHHRERPGDSINFETYHQAEYVCLPVFNIIKDFIESIQSHRLVFVKGHDRCTNISESPREKYEADHLFLNLLLSDLHNATIVRLEAGLAIDNITRAFLDTKVSENKLAPLWLVFAMKMLLDIRHALRNDTSQAFQEVQATGQRAIAAIRHYFQFSLNHGTHGKQWHKDNDPQIVKIISFISVWINQDLISKALRKQSKQSLEEHGVELPPFFLMKQHPLLCGSLVYWLNLSLQEFGISLANAYDSILSAAHLYNAARQENLLAISWPDMDYLISIHTSQRIFVGGPPLNLKTSLNDFIWHSGLVSSTSHAIEELLDLKSPRRMLEVEDFERPCQSTTYSGPVIACLKVVLNLRRPNLMLLSQRQSLGILKWTTSQHMQISGQTPPRGQFLQDCSDSSDPRHPLHDSASSQTRVPLLENN